MDLSKLSYEQLRYIFTLHIGCEVFAIYDEAPRRGILTGFHGEYQAEIQFYEEDGINVLEHPEYVEMHKTELNLSSLVTMSDDEAFTIATIAGFIYPSFNRVQMISIGRAIVATMAERTYFNRDIEPCRVAAIFQQLVQWNFAVPLYLGVGHPYNGLTAKEIFNDVKFQ